MEFVIIFTFIFGYIAIAFEQEIKINKTASALVTGVVCWTLVALATPGEAFIKSEQFTKFAESLHHPVNTADPALYLEYIGNELSTSLSSIASILFFLIGAMTIVELIDAHEGFKIITGRIKTRDNRKLLWVVCWITFFLSAFLDNLTTAIVMVMIIKKIINEREQRLVFAGMIIIAANAGGAWSPIGDVTTTMLWMGNRISAQGLIISTLLPSIVCLLLPLSVLTFMLQGEIKESEIVEEPPCSNGGLAMFSVGASVLILVPVFKTLTHLPPYMGMLLGLGIVWIVSELINPDLDEAEKNKYSVARALSRIDISSVLFFLGILMAVSALESMQTLSHLSVGLSNIFSNNRVIISLLGILSSVLDNVPLVAASMGMFSFETFPMDDTVWKYLAYCSGTGGSILLIGSAAGVAVMGMEKMEFKWYLKRISLLAFAGYAAGALAFLLITGMKF